MSTKVPQIDAHSSQFSAVAQASLVRLQRALAVCLRAAAPNVTRAGELCTTLRLDKSLAWKAHRLAYESDPTRIAQFLPGASGFRILVRAVTDAGADAPSIAEFQAAVDAYAELVQRHGGDRASVQIMLSGTRSEDRTQTSLRRDAFKAASFVAGVQADAYVLTFFVAKAKEPGRLDIALVRAFFGVRRLRERAVFSVTRPVVSGDQGQPSPVFVHEPLSDPATLAHAGGDEVTLRSAHEIGLIPEFCSRPMPRFARASVFHNRLDYELADGSVGKPGMVDCVVGEVLRSVVSNRSTPGNEIAEHAMQIRVPVRTAMLNVYVQDGALPPGEPTVAVYSEYRGEEFRRGPDRERCRVPGHEAVECPGAGPQAGNCTEAPRFTELAQLVFNRLQWPGEQFKLYRVRMQHPFVPCAALMSHRLFEE